MANSAKRRFASQPTNYRGTSSVLPRPDFHFPGEVGRTYLDSDPPQSPQPVEVPGAPNILLILIDDWSVKQVWWRHPIAQEFPPPKEGSNRGVIAHCLSIR